MHLFSHAFYTARRSRPPWVEHCMAPDINFVLRCDLMSWSSGAVLCEPGSLSTSGGGGRSAAEPGRLPALQAVGWWLEEASVGQVSMNLTDHGVTPIHVAYEEVCKEAVVLNLPVVGCVPLASVLQVRIYLTVHYQTPIHTCQWRVSAVRAVSDTKMSSHVF
jgi:hypothetical protein